MTTQQKDAPLVQEEMIEEWFESAWFYGKLSPEEWKGQLRAFATELYKHWEAQRGRDAEKK